MLLLNLIGAIKFSLWISLALLVTYIIIVAAQIGNLKFLLKSVTNIFVYTPFFLVMKKQIFCFGFLGLGILFYSVGSNLNQMAFFFIAIGLVDVLDFYFKSKYQLYNITVSSKTISYYNDSFKTISIVNISEIAFRHQIIYLLLNNKKSLAIKLEHVKNEKEFIICIKTLLKENNIKIENESLEKLNKY